MRARFKKEQILEMFHDSEMGSLLDPHDQKLISSVALL